MYCQYVEKICDVISSIKPREGLFFAYPSEPETSSDAIRKAIGLVKSDKTMKFPATGWEELSIEGNIIFCEICKAIRNVSCAVINTTYINFNVLFEYGFAIGSKKAIWPLVESGISRDELFSANVKGMTTIGHSEFTDGNSIYKKITKKKPWSRASQFEVPEALGKKPNRETRGILYVKSLHNNEASLRITESLSPLPIEVITDDPNEVSFRHVPWYLNQISKSYAVIIHLGSERMLNAKAHWAKCALVAGMSLALGRRLLLLGEDIKFEPIDYRDLIRNYKNASEAENIVVKFLEAIQKEISLYGEYVKYDVKLPGTPKDSVLGIVELGDYVAENEVHKLNEYFVETPEFRSALEPKFKIFVGRKGSGKTANFYMICNSLEAERRNVICKIKPKEYELNELLQFVKNELGPAENGYLLESLWKYMLYAEALKSVHDRNIEKAVGAWTPSEKTIENYFEGSSINASESFTSRLVKVVRDVYTVYSQSNDIKIAVSEILHVNEIQKMHEMLCAYVVDRCARFTIVIDGLDANWRLGEDHRIMADIILALIGAARDLWRDCIRDVHRYGKESSIVIFVRSDVFRIALERARDPDKVQYELIYWPNPESLMNVVVRRLIVSLGWEEKETFNWSDLLDAGFSYEDMYRTVSNNIILRPRDYIYYFQRVLYYTRLRGTKYLTKRDFDSALKEYSDYVVLSLSGESQPFIPSTVDLLLEFDRGKAVLTMEELIDVFKKADIGESNFRKVVEYLVEVNFLGYGIDDYNFRFPVAPQDETIILKRFLRHTKRNKGISHYKIHNAFHRALNIQ